MTHLFNDEQRRILIDGLIDGRHHAHVHHDLDDLGRLDGHLLRKFLWRNRLADAHITHDRRGRQLERMARLDAHCATTLTDLLFLFQARASISTDMQLLAAVFRTPIAIVRGGRCWRRRSRCRT